MWRYYAVFFLVLASLCGAVEEVPVFSDEGEDWVDGWCSLCCDLIQTEKARELRNELFLRKDGCTNRCKAELMCDELETWEDKQTCLRSNWMDQSDQAFLTEEIELIHDTSFQIFSRLGKYSKSQILKKDTIITKVQNSASTRKLRGLSRSEDDAERSDHGQSTSKIIGGTVITTLTIIFVFIGCGKRRTEKNVESHQVVAKSPDFDAAVLVGTDSIVLDDREEELEKVCVSINAVEAVDLEIEVKRSYMESSMKTVKDVHLLFLALDSFHSSQ